MAKKAVASLQGKSARFTRVIRMVRSSKTGAYVFKGAIVPADSVDDFLKEKEGEKGQVKKEK